MKFGGVKIHFHMVSEHGYRITNRLFISVSERYHHPQINTVDVTYAVCFPLVSVLSSGLDEGGHYAGAAVSLRYFPSGSGRFCGITQHKNVELWTDRTPFDDCGSLEHRAVASCLRRRWKRNSEGAGRLDFT